MIEAELRTRILRRFAGSAPQHELADWRVLGVDAERSQRLARHVPAELVPAAVLMPLVDRPEGLTVLLTQRASQLATPSLGKFLRLRNDYEGGISICAQLKDLD